ncbi:hypothetical protein F5Y17DRAFT_362532 [Xylariaceae sp. FL0594]|nr:hypothetical protein F5Y17DRAFT_362532 [Xylariaceae sp. FL0594]
MMAGWPVGGAEMSRSLSDSVVLPRYYHDQDQSYDTRERRHHEYRHQQRDSTDDYRIPQRNEERPRVYRDHNRYYHDSRLDQEPLTPPAFFIIKEAGRPSSTPAYDPESRTRERHAPHTAVAYHASRDNSPAPARTPRRTLPLRLRNDEEPRAVVPALPRQERKDNEFHDEAAKLVEDDMKDKWRLRNLSQHERILGSLISARALGAEFEIDDVALQGIFSATNKIFFRGSLAGRVKWMWDDLEDNIIGTTAWREAPSGDGYETLIILSRQILKSRKYNRRLVISTFIHELIHSYLFVYCGYQPDDCGGHTRGFRRIAQVVNDWVGEEDLLQLHKIEADLSAFEVPKMKTTTVSVSITRTGTSAQPRYHVRGGCQVQWLEDGTLGFIVLPPRPDPWFTNPGVVRGYGGRSDHGRSYSTH